MRNHTYENDFDLHENETACRIHFHMNGFALRLVLKQRRKRTRKWPILLKPSYFISLMNFALKWCFNCFILVCLLQALCRHHRQYQPHQGN